jgi:molybdenum cofactor cytidylyltransferase
MTALIILAAGASTRLGQPKQNLVFQRQTLLEKAIETGLASNCHPVIVVLGANAESINPQIQHNNLKVVHNLDWREGIASSIRAGLRTLNNHDSISEAIIMLCDQPFVNTELIRNMRNKHVEIGKSLVACSYQQTVGVPALFDKSLFSQLEALTGDEGAKKIINANVNDVATIPFEMGRVDIDTPADYARLIKGETDL